MSGVDGGLRTALAAGHGRSPACFGSGNNGLRAPGPTPSCSRCGTGRAGRALRVACAARRSPTGLGGVLCGGGGPGGRRPLRGGWCGCRWRGRGGRRGCCWRRVLGLAAGGDWQEKGYQQYQVDCQEHGVPGSMMGRHCFLLSFSVALRQGTFVPGPVEGIESWVRPFCGMGDAAQHYSIRVPLPSFLLPQLHMGLHNYSFVHDCSHYTMLVDLCQEFWPSFLIRCWLCSASGYAR